MSEMSLGERRFLGWSMVVVMPLLVAVMDFVVLFVTFRLVARIAPEAVGEVAANPGTFAAWVALVKVPFMAAYLVVMLAPTFRAFLATGEVSDPPVRAGWRRIVHDARNLAVELVSTAVAALIVFDRLVDPGDVRIWQLVALTVAGSYLVPKPVTGVFWLLRRWWRRRASHRRRPAQRDAEQLPEQPDSSPARTDHTDQVWVSPEPARGGIKPDCPERVGSGETPKRRRATPRSD